MLAIALLAMFGALGQASAQTTTTTSPPPPLSRSPPVSLSSLGKTKSSKAAKSSKPAATSTSSSARDTPLRGDLPKTGFDILEPALLGAGLLLAGLGLRLRTRDVRWR
jgi:LPXTG-motif cell wall-anchored protein